jgi:4'-phosphopantetheinyl transferase
VSRCECQQCACHGHGAGSDFTQRKTAQGAAESLDNVEFVESWRKQVRRSGSGAACSTMSQSARVEIWIAPVRTLIRHLAFAGVLSPEEALQFKQVRVATARDSMIAGRTLLRIALSHAVHGRLAPQDWRLRTSPSGKPEITEDLPQVHFSVAHTERLAVIATSQQLPVGIDAETIEQTVESNVASDFCCPGEQAILEMLPPSQSTREFVRLWTLKEAYAKLTGLGAAMDFSSLGFSFDSLHLAHAPPFAQELQVHFETMFVANGNGLSHVSLAIGLPRSVSIRVELQVMTLAKEPGPSAIHVPCVASHLDGPLARETA